MRNSVSNAIVRFVCSLLAVMLVASLGLGMPPVSAQDAGLVCAGPAPTGAVVASANGDKLTAPVSATPTVFWTAGFEVEVDAKDSGPAIVCGTGGKKDVKLGPDVDEVTITGSSDEVKIEDAGGGGIFSIETSDNVDLAFDDAAVGDLSLVVSGADVKIDAKGPNPVSVTTTASKKVDLKVEGPAILDLSGEDVKIDAKGLGPVSGTATASKEVEVMVEGPAILELTADDEVKVETKDEPAVLTIVSGDKVDVKTGDAADGITVTGADVKVSSADGDDFVELAATEKAEVDLGKGDDILNGSASTGDVKANGKEGADILTAGTGDDELKGDEGDDVLDGGIGTDSLDGGPQTDSCDDGETVTTCEIETSNGEPGLEIFQPSEGAEIGPDLLRISITADASVTSVEVKVDGTVVATLEGPDYTAVLTDLALAPGPHLVEASAGGASTC